MRIVSEDVEGIWREAWITAPDGARTFHEELTKRWQSARALNAAGSLANVSKNSTSQSASTPHPDTITSVQVERNHLAARRLYDRLTVELVTTDETAIYNEGLSRFSDSVTEVQNDYSLAGCYR